MMIRRSFVLTVMAVALLPFSSCTCRESTPEPPAKLSSGGFGAIVTPRKLPNLPDQKHGKIEAPVVEAKPAPTPPPALPDQNTVPDSFPEGVPIPEHSEVMAVQNLANGANNVVFATEGESSQIFDLYKGSMEKSGWGSPTQQYQAKDQSFLTFKKGNTITNISVTKDPKTGRRIVAVMYYEEKPLPFAEF